MVVFPQIPRIRLFVDIRYCDCALGRPEDPSRDAQREGSARRSSLGIVTATVEQTGGLGLIVVSHAKTPCGI